MTDKVLSPPAHVEPVVFTRDQLDWLPWLEPMAEQDLTARHMAGLVDAARAKSPYFRLLARDPEVLEARTRTDKDIFYNSQAGAPRAERELALFDVVGRLAAALVFPHQLVDFVVIRGQEDEGVVRIDVRLAGIPLGMRGFLVRNSHRSLHWLPTAG